MTNDPLGLTLTVPDGQDAIGVYESESGLECYMADGSYLLSDAHSLIAPLPVFFNDGPVYADSMGNARHALAVRTGDAPPPEGITWDSATTWDDNTYWS